jgi:hypothetical protein
MRRLHAFCLKTCDGFATRLVISRCIWWDYPGVANSLLLWRLISLTLSKA